jgi:hypothetical protein
MIVDTVFVLAMAFVIEGDSQINTKAYTYQTRAECRASKAEVYASGQRVFTAKHRDGTPVYDQNKYLVFVSDCEAVPVERFVNQGR